MAEALQTHLVSFGPVLRGCCVHVRRQPQRGPCPSQGPRAKQQHPGCPSSVRDGQAAALGGFWTPAGNPGEGRAGLWPLLSEAVGAFWRAGSRRARQTPGLSAPQTRAECSLGGGQAVRQRGSPMGSQGGARRRHAQLRSLCAPNPGSLNASFESAESGRKGAAGVSCRPQTTETQRRPLPRGRLLPSSSSPHPRPPTPAPGPRGLCRLSSQHVRATCSELPGRWGGREVGAGEAGEKRSGPARGFLPPWPRAWVRTALSLGPCGLRLSMGLLAPAWPLPPRGPLPGCGAALTRTRGAMAAP